MLAIMGGTGLFFVFLGAFCLKTGILPGGRTGGMKSFLAYPYGLLFIVVGIGAWVMAAKDAYASATLVGSCNQRETLRQCVELHDGSLDLVRGQACVPGSVTENACPTDNLVGRCELEGPARTLFVYSDMWEREEPEEIARCAQMGGTWSK